jgi:hypothetical protein
MRRKRVGNFPWLVNQERPRKIAEGSREFSRGFFQQEDLQLLSQCSWINDFHSICFFFFKYFNLHNIFLHNLVL